MSREKPSEEQIIQWFDTLSNWGRWGKDDVLGTLNLITPEKIKRAAGLVREGTTVSCARTITYESGIDVLFQTRHFMMSSGDAEPAPDSYGRQNTMDAFLFAPHGSTITHLDAPSHTLWRSDPSKPRTMYNGLSDKGVTTAGGAALGSIEIVRGGITTRGVLLDIPGVFDVDWLEPGTSIFPDDLDAAEKRQGVSVEPGDLLFVRTGHLKRRNTIGTTEPAFKWAGLQGACLPWLKERDVAVMSSDTAQDVAPPDYPNIGFPIHGIGMAAMGMWVLDNADLEELSEVCRRMGRWEFFISVGPPIWQNGTGTPVNPIAIF